MVECLHTREQSMIRMMLSLRITDHSHMLHCQAATDQAECVCVTRRAHAHYSHVSLLITLPDCRHHSLLPLPPTTTIQVQRKKTVTFITLLTLRHCQLNIVNRRGLKNHNCLMDFIFISSDYSREMWK